MSPTPPSVAPALVAPAMARPPARPAAGETRFGFALMAPPFLAPALTSAALLLLCVGDLLRRRGRLPLGLLGLCAPLVGLLVLGLAGAAGNNAYDVGKDGWYIGKSLLALTAGYLLMARLGSLERLGRLIVFGGALMASVHLLRLALHPGALALGLDEMRLVLGRGFFLCTLAIALVGATHRVRLGIFRHRSLLWAAAALSFASLLLSFSRTQWACLALLALPASGALDAGTLRRGVRALALTLAAVALLAGAAELAGRSRLGPLTHATHYFTQKLEHTWDELLLVRYRKPSDIARYYRGFESLAAYRAYARGTTEQKLLGQGFGTSVDLGISLPLGEEGAPIRFVPILHNGYLYLLLKTGALGLALYLGWLLWCARLAWRQRRRSGPRGQLAGRLLLGLCLCVAATTFVIGGIFNAASLIPYTVIIGALTGYLRRPETPSSWGVAAGRTP